MREQIEAATDAYVLLKEVRGIATRAIRKRSAKILD
jgi:hypothetical protein